MAITGTIGTKYFIAISTIWKDKVFVINFVRWSLIYFNFGRGCTSIREKWITGLLSLGMVQKIMLMHENFATFITFVFFHLIGI